MEIRDSAGEEGTQNRIPGSEKINELLRNIPFDQFLPASRFTYSHPFSLYLDFSPTNF